MLTARLAHYLGRPLNSGPGENEPDLHSQVRRLEIRARKAMQAGLAGQYASAFRGRGLEFEEVRDYRRGDDVRNIDWNVTARTGRLHVKLYREERDLTLLLLVDLSASTRFGSGVMTVHDLIAEAASLFALAAARRDSVGAVVFDEGLRSVIPPRLGWRHGLRVVRELLGAVPGGRGTAFADALRAAARLLHRRGIVIAVVDWACPLPKRELGALAGRHEVVLVRVGDPLLRRGAAKVAVPVRDAEGGARGVLASIPAHAIAGVPPGIDVVQLTTDQDYLPVVRQLLQERERRYARG